MSIGCVCVRECVCVVSEKNLRVGEQHFLVGSPGTAPTRPASAPGHEPVRASAALECGEAYLDYCLIRCH